jgi:hypothetical protein
MSEAAAQYWRMRAALAVSDALPPADAAAFSAALVGAEKNNISIERAMKWPANWRIRMMASGDEVRGEPGDSRIRQASCRQQKTIRNRLIGLDYQLSEFTATPPVFNRP